MAGNLLRVTGPNTVFTNATIEFTAEVDEAWTPQELLQIRWRYSFDGKLFTQLVATGARLKLQIPRSFAGHWFVLEAFGPDQRSAKSTAVVVLKLGDTPYPVPEKAIAGVEVKPKAVPRRKGKFDYQATVNGRTFTIGRNASYTHTDGTQYQGLGSALSLVGPLYSASAYSVRHGHWAWLMHPTLTAEGQASFAATNTYDIARVTFGLIQFVVIYPDKNLILLLRKMLALPEGKLVFPDLELREIDGQQRICDKSGNPLETKQSTVALCNLLNPKPAEIDAAEGDTLARLVYWVRSSASVCDLQVDLAVATFKDYLRQLHGKGIDGCTDMECAVAADILNQGRGKLSAIQAALAQPKGQRYSALLAIDKKDKQGHEKFLKRRQSLAGAIDRLFADGVLGFMCYKESTASFESCEGQLIA